jgi:hypothetical protein
MAVKRAITSTSIHQDDLVLLLEDIIAAIAALKADHNTLRAKLNLDGGVTDTDYAASTATTPSLNP